jgi:hypothetical protein
MTNLAETTPRIDGDSEKNVIEPRLGDRNGETLEDTKEEVHDPIDDSNKLERWNHPRINMYRYLTTLFCFINMGMNDAAYGVCLS